MAILLVRHAEAVPEGPATDDSARFLTEQGRRQALELGAALVQRSLPLGVVMASPRVRAVQTAELLARALGYEGMVEVAPSLSFTIPAERAKEALAAREAQTSGVVVAVGHMPTIAQIARMLTNGRYTESLGLAEAVYIDGGSVVWSASPR